MSNVDDGDWDDEPETIQSILGTDTLQGKEGPVKAESLNGKYVLIYFSAHWCPPCRGFTPVLAEFHKAAAASKNFEVFVSSDKNQKSFDEYYVTCMYV